MTESITAASAQREAANKKRDALRERLTEEGIGTLVSDESKGKRERDQDRLAGYGLGALQSGDVTAVLPGEQPKAEATEAEGKTGDEQPPESPAEETPKGETAKSTEQDADTEKAAEGQDEFDYEDVTEVYLIDGVEVTPEELADAWRVAKDPKATRKYADEKFKEAKDLREQAEQMTKASPERRRLEERIAQLETELTTIRSASTRQTLQSLYMQEPPIPDRSLQADDPAEFARQQAERSKWRVQVREAEQAASVPIPKAAATPQTTDLEEGKQRWDKSVDEWWAPHHDAEKPDQYLDAEQEEQVNAIARRLLNERGLNSEGDPRPYLNDALVEYREKRASERERSAAEQESTASDRANARLQRRVTRARQAAQKSGAEAPPPGISTLDDLSRSERRAALADARMKGTRRELIRGGKR